MSTKFVVRNGNRTDYAGILEAEQKAWTGTMVPVISQNQYEAWLEIFPEGIIVAEFEGKICAHHFSQIISFNWTEVLDNHSWDNITDKGFCRKTHDGSGNILYGVSISSSHKGAGRAVFQYALSQVGQLKLEGYVGACRIPGLFAYARKLQTQPDIVVEDYVAKVSTGQIQDYPLTTFLSIKGVVFDRVLPNYFEDYQSANWACLITYKVR